MAVVADPITPAFGVEITGIRATDLEDPHAAARVQAALDRYGVVVYREVHLDDDELLAFSRRLGSVLVQPTGEHRHPEIQTITMDPTRTNPTLASYRKGNFHWHIDGATMEVPQKATLLTAREVDPAGGDTEFASTYAAYMALPVDDKWEIENLHVVHSFAAAQSLVNPEASERERASWRDVPARTHPLVWKRRDGRRSLVVGATADRVVGWSTQDSKELLDRLVLWITQRRFTIRHRWRKGDLVIWDNTGMLHRGLPFNPTSVRLMHRTTLVGDEPVSAYTRTSARAASKD